MFKKALLIALAVTVLNVGTVFLADSMSYAQGIEPPEEEFHLAQFRKMSPEKREAFYKKKEAEMANKLGLTEEQRSKIKQNREASKAKLESYMEQIKAEKDKLKALLEDPNSSKNALMNQFETISSLKTKMMRVRFENMISIKEMLTPDQQKKFKELMAQHKKRDEKRFGSQRRKGIFGG